MSAFKESAAAFWQERNKRERIALALAALVVFGGLFYALLIDPALSGRARLASSLPVLRQQSADLQAMAQQAAALNTAASQQLPALSKESIESTLNARGLKPLNVVLTGGMVRVQLAGASFAALVEWIDQSHKTARLSVIEANITPLAAPDSVNATLTLRQPQIAR
jgi:general secretion pathway protein M